MSKMPDCLCCNRTVFKCIDRKKKQTEIEPRLDLPEFQVNGLSAMYIMYTVPTKYNVPPKHIEKITEKQAKCRLHRMCLKKQVTRSLRTSTVPSIIYWYILWWTPGALYGRTQLSLSRDVSEFCHQENPPHPPFVLWSRFFENGFGFAEVLESEAHS